MMRVLAFAVLISFSQVHAKDGGHATARGSAGPTSGGTMAGTPHGGGGGSSMRGGMGELRPAPPMDPARKVTEQDCSKPVDPQGANLRCK